MDITVRETIKLKIKSIGENIKTLSPDELSENLVELSSLYANFSEGLTGLEQVYAQKKLEFLTGEKKISVAEATLYSETTPEYKEFAEARRLEKALVEVIRSIKVRIRLLGSEYEVSSNL